MPELRRVAEAEAIRALERWGFERIRQRSSHAILKNQTPDGEIGCVVPPHRERAIGTLRGTLKEAVVAQEQFIENL